MKIHEESSKLSFDGGPSSNIRLLNDYGSSNPLFWKRFVLVIEFTIEVTIIEVIDLWKWLHNVL